MSSRQRSSERGFSLIELMVVVSIMAILAVIGLGGFSNAQKKARDSRRKADIKTMQNAMISSSDTGGNLDAAAAEAELSGSFPIDPRKQGQNSTYYLLYAPVTSDKEWLNDVSGIQFIENTENNTGLACAVLEATGTGNADDIRLAASTGDDAPPSEPFTLSGVDTENTIDSIVGIDPDAMNQNSTVLTKCETSATSGQHCNLFCATF